jgi:hypothetical protein
MLKGRLTEKRWTVYLQGVGYDSNIARGYGRIETTCDRGTLGRYCDYAGGDLLTLKDQRANASWISNWKVSSSLGQP